MPEISVITVCYNEPELEKTCESIVNQTYQDFEWIVIDGGSKQETLDIFEKYKYRIDKFISEKDNGIYNAMNKGILLASGKYLHFLNAGDCYYENTALQKVVEQNLDKDIVCGNIQCIDKENKSNIVMPPQEIDELFLYTDTLPHQASFIKRDLFEKYGLYNENYRIVSDWEKWVVFILENHCTYKYIDQIIAVFDLGGISSTRPDLLKKEREEVLSQRFSEKERHELDILNERKNVTYTLVERLFSIKNNPRKTCKIVTILGLKFKIKRKKK